MKKILLLSKKGGLDKSLKTWMDFSVSVGGSIPSPDQQVIISDFIKAYKKAGLWDSSYPLYLPANDGGEILGTINITDPTKYRLLEVMDNVYVQNKGFESATGAMNTQWDKTQFTDMSESSFSMFIYKQQVINSVHMFFGGRTDGTTYSQYFPYTNASSLYFKMATKGTALGASSREHGGLLKIARSESSVTNQSFFYKDGVITEQSGIKLFDSSLDPVDIYIGGLNENGSLLYPSNIGWGYWSVNNSNLDKSLIESNLVNAYMTAILDTMPPATPIITSIT